MITPEAIQAGNSYTCTFTVKNIPLDEWGRPGGMMSMADLPVCRYGDYTSIGSIVARDTEQGLFEVQDHNSDGKPKKYVVTFADVSDIQMDEAND